MKGILIVTLCLIFILLIAGCSSSSKSQPSTPITTKATLVPLIQQTSSPTTPLPTSLPTSTRATTSRTPTPSKTMVSGPPCDCSGDKYNCKDFPLSNGVSAYECFNYCKSMGKGDVHRLDRDGDGHVCES